jgi:hypothetical protein
MYLMFMGHLTNYGKKTLNFGLFESVGGYEGWLSAKDRMSLKKTIKVSTVR